MMEKKRCLIENELTIDTGWCGQFERFKNDLLPNEEMEDFFNIIIVDASGHKVETLHAIMNSDEIWIDSSFVGESGRLLVMMLDKAVELDIKNKTIINMREFSDVAWHLPEEARPLIKSLKEKGNKFIYSDSKDYETYLPVP